MFGLVWIGAFLFHVVCGQEKPVSYALRMPSSAEKSYMHFEKEVLTVVFGVKRFHKYTSGREFTIYSNHLSLASLFGQTKAIPQDGCCACDTGCIYWQLISTS